MGLGRQRPVHCFVRLRGLLLDSAISISPRRLEADELGEWAHPRGGARRPPACKYFLVVDLLCGTLSEGPVLACLAIVLRVLNRVAPKSVVCLLMDGLLLSTRAALWAVRRQEPLNLPFHASFRPAALLTGRENPVECCDGQR